MVFLFSCSTTGNSRDSGLVSNLDTAVAKTAEAITEKVPAGTKIALFNISENESVFTEYVIEELSALLVERSNFIIVDRKNRDVIEAEQNFQMSGNVRDEDIRSIGQNYGAASVVTCSITGKADLRRLRVRTLDVETGEVQSLTTHPIGDIANDPKYNTQSSTTLENNIAGSSWTASYVDEDEQDEMFILVFGKNTVRVDEIEYAVPDGLKFTSPYISTFDIGTWSQTGKNINVKFYENIENYDFIIINRVLWEFKLKIITDGKMEGTILNNGELIGNAELYKK
jgi:TolB-like protein